MAIIFGWFGASVIGLEAICFGLVVLSTIARVIVSDIREMYL